MRLLDADILAYALYDESPAHQEAWSYLEHCINENLPLHITPTTILETYNTLYWYYKVRPLKLLIEKIKLILEAMTTVETSIDGLTVSQTDNIPLGDGFLIATAKKHKLPIIVSNDQHIIKQTPKHGLLHENPITAETRAKLGTQ
ncbi:MAG: type II toxin-antitoxin system VapC family toxin [Candidatus Bathyarchaeota archaeon]|nr:type II toxin-antitoxin system VapC family toxin [Candidatus Bathyarchaeota archaeon]